VPVAGDGREAAAAVLVRLSTVWWMTIKQHRGDAWTYIQV
jgi:hypothetical protein